jgi:hypothetical protein
LIGTSKSGSLQSKKKLQNSLLCDIKSRRQELLNCQTDSQKIISTLLRFVSDKVEWRKLKLVEIQDIHKSISGTRCNKVKELLIDDTIARCNSILNSGGLSHINTSYGDNSYTNLVSADLLRSLPKLLLHPRAECDCADGKKLNQKLMASNLSSRKNSVLEYRGGKDLYSDLSIDQIRTPHVDHILERQLMAHAMETADLSVQSCASEAICGPIKLIINQNFNLNVTLSDLNISKGNAVSAFIKEDRVTSRPQPLHVLLFSTASGTERKIGKYTNNVMEALDEAFPAFEEAIRCQRRLDRHVTGAHFGAIADSLAVIFKKAGVEEYVHGNSSSRRA